MKAEAKLKELGLDLLSAPAPIANYVPAVRTGNLLFISGTGPPAVPALQALQAKRGADGQLKVGRDLTAEEGYQFARYTALAILSRLKAELGDLDRVRRVVKVLGMVNCAEDFGQQPQVMNGCSDLIVEVLGQTGRHARSAVGMQALPNGIPVEIEMILEVE